jgi:hypothetical protein
MVARVFAAGDFLSIHHSQYEQLAASKHFSVNRKFRLKQLI